MFKVSFKENPQFPVKKVQRFNDDRVTVVTLKGVAQLPVFLQYFIPHKVFDWTGTLKNVDVEFTMTRMFITVTGKSICSKEDKVDKVLGERIAEARAKLHLYKFMAHFLNKVCLNKVWAYFIEQLCGTATIKCIADEKDVNKEHLSEAVNKYWRLYKDEQKHLNILLGHESNTKSSQKH